MAKQAQFQADDQTFTVAENRLPEEGVKRFTEVDNTRDSKPAPSGHIALIIWIKSAT